MSRPAPKRENLWLNLGFNVALPALMLIKGKDLVGVVWTGSPHGLTIAVFVLALAFPLSYGIADFIRRRSWNFFSAVGIIGVVLTGGIGLLQLPAQWVAVKEAAVPAVLGLAVLLSQVAGRPLLRLLLLRPEFLDTETVETRLRERGNEAAFERLVRRSNLLFAASFGLSAVLNYVLAKMIVTSPGGTDAFNEELGRMTLLSYPVIAVPTMVVTIAALWLLFHGMERLTGLDIEDVLRHGGRDGDQGR